MQDIFKKENILKLTVIVGIAGIMLIFCSTVFSGNKAKEDTFAEVSESEADTLTQYRQELCDELGNMLASIQQRETSADKQSNEKQSCIVIRQNDGSEKALTVGQLMPKIKGVLIVCEGGDDSEICERLSEAVSAALDVNKTHICVTKMNT